MQASVSPAVMALRSHFDYRIRHQRYGHRPMNIRRRDAMITTA